MKNNRELDEILDWVKSNNIQLERVYKNLIEVVANRLHFMDGEVKKEFTQQGSLKNGIFGEIDIELSNQSEYIRRVATMTKKLEKL